MYSNYLLPIITIILVESEWNKMEPLISEEEINKSDEFFEQIYKIENERLSLF